MSAVEIRPALLLTAVDLSNTSALAVERAVGIAQRARAAELHFLHVTSRSQSEPSEPQERNHNLLAWLGRELESGGELPPGTRVVCHEAEGEPAPAIVQTASDLDADLVIVGTHGRRGVRRWMLGSVAESVVRSCGCPVLVVRRKMHHHTAPQIEPPCAACTEARLASRGEVFWCERHRLKHGRRHAYYDTQVSTWIHQRNLP